MSPLEGASKSMSPACSMMSSAISPDPPMTISASSAGAEARADAVLPDSCIVVGETCSGGTSMRASSSRTPSISGLPPVGACSGLSLMSASFGLTTPVFDCFLGLTERFSGAP